VSGPLGLDDDALVACVACGLCLPHCPTYRVTGFEIASPRGRIAAMRTVEEGRRPIDAAFADAMETCVQCRGCEVACPSAVPFGHLMEQTRAALHDRHVRSGSRSRRLAAAGALRVVPRHRLLIVLTWVLLVAQRLRLVPRRFGLPRLSRGSLRPLDVPVATAARAGTGEAWLFTGCVADAWQRDVHRAAAAVMRACGAAPVRPGSGAACCGALHLHLGHRVTARALAARVVAAMPGDAAVVVDSAGCGAMLRDYATLLGTPEAQAFSARVQDFSEWVAARGVPPVRATGTTVVVQDPCHLRHVQRAHGTVRTVLATAYALAETDDDGLCCGAGGAYAALRPELAGEIRARKVAALRAAGGDAVVASANPGCSFHLAAAGCTVRHPAQLLADALERPADG
jgi:glycolate oxidase iron-sulfur subunit